MDPTTITVAVIGVVSAVVTGAIGHIRGRRLTEAQASQSDATAVQTLVAATKELIDPLRERIAQQEERIAHLEAEVTLWKQHGQDAIERAAVAEAETARLQAECIRLRSKLPPRSEG